MRAEQGKNSRHAVRKTVRIRREQAARAKREQAPLRGKQSVSKPPCEALQKAVRYRFLLRSVVQGRASRHANRFSAHSCKQFRFPSHFSRFRIQPYNAVSHQNQRFPAPSCTTIPLSLPFFKVSHLAIQSRFPPKPAASHFLPIHILPFCLPFPFLLSSCFTRQRKKPCRNAVFRPFLQYNVMFLSKNASFLAKPCPAAFGFPSCLVLRFPLSSHFQSRFPPRLVVQSSANRHAIPFPVHTCETIPLSISFQSISRPILYRNASYLAMQSSANRHASFIPSYSHPYPARKAEEIVDQQRTYLFLFPSTFFVYMSIQPFSFRYPQWDVEEMRKKRKKRPK